MVKIWLGRRWGPMPARKFSGCLPRRTFWRNERDEALLDRRVALHPDHLLEQKLVAGEGGWLSQSLVLVPANGIEHRSTIDTRVLFLLSQCHGARTVREMISSVGESDGTDSLPPPIPGFRWSNDCSAPDCWSCRKTDARAEPG